MPFSEVIYHMIVRYIFQNGDNNMLFLCICTVAAFSESEFLEKEINLWLLFVFLFWVIISVREDSLDILQHILSGFFVGHFIISDNRLELYFIIDSDKFSGNLESSWENMIVIDEFDKWLEFASSSLLFLAHSSGNSERTSLYTSDNGMPKILVLVFITIIKLLDNDGFLSSSSSSK